MAKKIILFLIGLFLNASWAQVSLAQACACHRETTYNCGSTAGSMYCPPYGCLVPETFCPPTQYCSFYIPGYSGCFNCPVSNPDCNALTPSLRPPDKITQTRDPVDIFSGEAYFSSTDFSFQGQGPRLSLFRKYRSFSTLGGIFGYGWRTDFDLNLTRDGSGNVTITDANGTQIYFTNNSGTYINSPANFSTLTKNADNTYTITDKHGNATHYDISGRLNSVTDRNGNTLIFVYKPSQVGGTYIQDATGRKIVLNFDANGHVISSVDPTGKMFQYGYDTNGNLVSITDPVGAVTNYAYDANHKIIQFTNANGHHTYYQYDVQGREVMNTQDNNTNKATLNYQVNNTTVVTDSLGHLNTYVFNNAGLLISHIDPLGNVTQQTWDGNMDLTSVTDARNNVTDFLYDVQGNLLQITDPLGNQTNMTYTSNFNLISSKTDALGHVTDYIYDIKGNLISLVDALGKTHSFVYDQFGNVITATDSRGNSMHFAYDAMGHMIQKTGALGDATNFTYE